MIGEVGLACCIQTRNGGHQFVVHPQSAHGVVRCRINTHWCLVRIFTRDALIHLEQVAVTLLHYFTTQAINCRREVKVDAIF